MQVTFTAESRNPRGAKGLSRLLSCVSRRSTFHDIPQMESLLAGCNLLDPAFVGIWSNYYTVRSDAVKVLKSRWNFVKAKTTTLGNNIYTLLRTFIAFTSFISSKFQTLFFPYKLSYYAWATCGWTSPAAVLRSLQICNLITPVGLLKHLSS